MSFVRDLLHTSTQTNVPLSLLVPQQEPNGNHHDDSALPGPSTAYRSTRPPHRRANSSPGPHMPLQEDDSDPLSATPRASTDGARPHLPSAAEATRTSSVCSTATSTPMPSRAPSPRPSYHSGTSSCSSDSESEQDSALLPRTRRSQSWQDGDRLRWQLFPLGSSSSRRERANWRRRRRRCDFLWSGSCNRWVRRVLRHPFVPKTPITILLTLLFLTLFGVSLTYLLIYILNPDKEPLPWRGYCTLPQYSGGPPSLSLSTTAFLQTPIPTNFTIPPFPPPDFDQSAPAGVFVGVFSMDTSVERRMLVRSTWANHVRSREGAGAGDDGVGTSRTIVRFILGQPRKEWERQIKLEMETYKDLVILPITENMNRGKTHAYFSWAVNNSWVPPLYFDTFERVQEGFTYLNATTPAPAPASHDPVHAHRDQANNTQPRPWVRPDYVVKADDDAFVMLAELEARLRVELYKDNLPPLSLQNTKQQSSQLSQLSTRKDDDGTESSSIFNFRQIASYLSPSASAAVTPNLPAAFPLRDPLVFWGYLVKNRFMAGELYALSYALVHWVGNDPVVRTMTHGAEDKQTSKWIRAHPYAGQVRWSSERCWIYDHPRGGTVYSHGFLFPSEVNRVQETVHGDLEHLAQQQNRPETSTASSASALGQFVPAPEKWAHSTVSKFGARYSPPAGNLSLDYSVEALVEGSYMSLARDDGLVTSDWAWEHREGRQRRYAGQRVGGSVVVHFIKKNMWFLEAAAALLYGDDMTALERTLEQAHTPTGKEENELEMEKGDAEVEADD